MTAVDVILQGLTASEALLLRHVNDLTPQEYLHRAAPTGNCTAWLIGHLTLTERRPLALLGQADLPTLPEGFEKRFARDATAPFANEFGDVSLLVPLFQKHRALLIDTVRRAPAELLDKPLEKPHPMFATVGLMTNFMSFHTVLHTGQISMIRRTLGKPPTV